MTELLASFEDQQTAASAASRLRALIGDVTVDLRAPDEDPAAARQMQRSESNEMEAMPAVGLSFAPGVGKAWMFGALAWGVIGAAAGAVVGAIFYFLTHGRLALLVAMIVSGTAAGAVAGMVDAGGMRATQEHEQAEEIARTRVVLHVAAPSTQTLEDARHLLEEMHPQRLDVVA